MEKGSQYAMNLRERLRRGEEELADWDIEELIRGKRRDKKGGFRGPRPKFVPSEIHEELARRVHGEVLHDLRAIVYENAGPLIKKVLRGELAPEEVPGFNLQMKTLQDLFDRVGLSKKQDIEIKGTMTHEHILQDVTIDRSLDELEAEDDEVIEAEVIDEDDDDEWDF